MKTLSICLAGVVLTATAASAIAQQLPTTVQLPTYSYFGVGTSVWVPDRGSTYLGGINRASSGMSEFGSPLSPFRNRSWGSERSAAGMSVSVYVHDFEAMDEALLRQAGGALLQPRQPALAGSRPQLRPDAGPPALESVAEIRRQRAREQLSREEEAASFVKRARAAEEAGKLSVAKIYYQMAARRASGDLKQQIAARLESLSPVRQAPKLAQDTPNVEIPAMEGVK